MTQEVYMPDGRLVFKTDNERLMYDDRIVQSMLRNGYTVKVDGRKVRIKKDAKRSK